jgi:hypothetical protein
MENSNVGRKAAIATERMVNSRSELLMAPRCYAPSDRP